MRNPYDIKEGQIEEQRPGLMREAERFFVLQQIDTLWREHLQSMDALRESVGLRGYGQKARFGDRKLRLRSVKLA